jgi:glycosyltransferase involved in cell wall biosynthesis
MNIFVVPSWYPSEDYPISGIMIKEQYEAICRLNPSVRVGISLWGQKEKNYLLWIKDHFKNLKKISSVSNAASYNRILPNLTEYRKPAFTWTQQLAKGNLAGIVKANLYNLKAFEADFGPVHMIHAHAAQPAGLIAQQVSKITGIPYCITERMGPFPSSLTLDRSGHLTKAYQEVYKCSKINIAVSPFLETAMQAHKIKNTTVIPDFANEHFFKPATPVPSDTFTFFFLGRIEGLKGITELLQAMQLVTKLKKNVKLRISGVGPQSETFKNLAHELHLEKAVTWLSHLDRSKTLAEFQQCNVFVLPSHYETFGISYIEAMACGKPVIATKCGGPESIINTTNGLLVEKEDPASLAKAMLHITDNYATYSSRNIRQDFLTRYSSQAVVPLIMNLYTNLIFNNSPKQ